LLGFAQNYLLFLHFQVCAVAGFRIGPTAINKTMILKKAFDALPDAMLPALSTKTMRVGRLILISLLLQGLYHTPIFAGTKCIFPSQKESSR
jgi:hypothetical protein